MGQRQPRSRARGEALVGALIVASVMALLVIGMLSLGVAGGQGETVSLTQLAAVSAAEAGLNVVTKMVNDTLAYVTGPAIAQNAGFDSYTSWVSPGASGSWSGIQSGFGTMVAGYTPFQVSGSVPNELGNSAEAAFLGASGTAPGPGSTTLTWYAVVAIIAVPTPWPTHNAPYSQPETWTIPLGLRAHAWVWGQDASYLGEVTSYSPSATTGSVYIVRCNGFYDAKPCQVTITLPQTQLTMNDPNVTVPAHP